jgi:ribosomal-protein-alanine N-acetyltransferase
MRREGKPETDIDLARRMRFEPMRLGDLDEVMGIEVLSFPTPWSRAAYQRELITNGYAAYLVGRLDGRIISYGGMWVILDEAHITNIAVHPDFRERGVGGQAMAALEEKARALGACRITLEVRVSNTGARHLYERLGYRGTGVRRNYYSDTREDAIVMWKDLAACGEVSGDGDDDGRPGR